MESKSLKELFELSENGNTYAQFELGERYYHGNGVEQNYIEAVKWFTKSAFTWKYERYNGSQWVPCGQEVHEWVRYEDNRNGFCRFDFDGKQWLQSECATDYQEFYEYAGCDFAAYCLGNCYLNGEGVDKDVYKALGAWEFSAEQGCQGATMELANFYANLTEPNYEKAAYWWERASEIGFPEASYKIARCYHEGQGVEKDEKQALKYLQCAMDDFFDISTYDKEWYVKICELAIKLGDEKAKDILEKLNR